MSPKSEAERTDAVRDQGTAHGLFRACMDEIRSSHTLGQALRTAALTAGLLTDATCYAELLGQFYAVTAALEGRIEALVAAEGVNSEATTSLVVKIHKKLGYSFKRGYEQDLHSLLGPEWKDTMSSWTTPPARRYIRQLQSATEVEVAAAAFILHGPLVIGGGAALKPRVERAFGKGCTHVFEDVIGTARGGRSARRKEFIEFYDALLEGAGSKDEKFHAIVHACGEFMQLNNEMMLAVRQAPWWRKYVAASVVAAASAVVWRVFAYDGAQPAVVLSRNSTG